MRPYADTNFFTRFYLSLPESEAAVTLLETNQSAIDALLPVTWLQRIEFVNALQLYVFRARTLGQARITREQAAAALAAFRDDLSARQFVSVMPVHLERLEQESEEIALRHSALFGFRTYDVLHVSSALILGCDAFWSFDPKAIKLAALEGLKTNALATQ